MSRVIATEGRMEIPGLNINFILALCQLDYFEIKFVFAAELKLLLIKSSLCCDEIKIMNISHITKAFQHIHRITGVQASPHIPIEI